MSEQTVAGSASGISARYQALLDPGSSKRIETAGALTLVEGRCDGRLVRVALTDRSVAGGSFGVDESDCLSRFFLRSRDDQTPIVLVLDSAGARLDSGLAGLAAFRRMYFSALQLRVAGVPMVALVERDCFGGASMLAMLCMVRGALHTARIGMSGPAIIEALSGKQDLDASDRSAVRSLFGAPARAQAGSIDLVFDAQTSRREVLSRLVRLAVDAQRDIRVQHQQLKQRLGDAGIDPGSPALVGAAASFRCGLPVGAVEIWQLADAILSAERGQVVILRVDCPGQAATRRDELLVLSEYVAHLAHCLRDRCISGVEIIMRIEGESAGGIYVALAAGAERVDATPQAVVRLLPAKAIQVVLGKTVPDESLADALAVGIVDRVVTAPEDGKVP